MRSVNCKKLFRQYISLLVVISFIFQSVFSSSAFAQTINLVPQPGQMVQLSNRYIPPLLKGIKVDPKNPLVFTFIVDSGYKNLTASEVKFESERLIKYFMAGLTVPENDLWVNLSPHESDRIISNDLGKTDMGRDLLAQDYLLKQLTSSLIYPEDSLGKKFWDRIYKRALEEFGTTDIPVNTFNKVWITPEKAKIFETENSAFITESRLKVLLEEDYLQLQHNINSTELGLGEMDKETVVHVNSVSSQIIKEIILPEIEKEVNEGENFAPLRQIYHSLLLADWFEAALKETMLAKAYVNQNKTNGIELEDPSIKVSIYEQYLEAFKKGVYNLIKEEIDPETNEIVPRKYFSGGYKHDKGAMTRSSNPEDFNPSDFTPEGKIFLADAALTVIREMDKSTITPTEQEIQNALDYWGGKLETTPLKVKFRGSRKDDVPDITEMPEQEGLELEAIGFRSLVNGRGKIAKLIAGGSSRMNPHQAPQSVLEMNNWETFDSKAAVPLVEIDGKVYTYLDAFGYSAAKTFTEIAQTAEELGIKDHRVYKNDILLMTNDAYRPEHDAILKKNEYYGLSPEQFEIFHQPLRPVAVATPADTMKLKSKFTEEEFEIALKISKEAEAAISEGHRGAVILPGEYATTGHAEFAHQIIEQGIILKMYDNEQDWIYVSNIDNYSADLGRLWLRLLGMFIRDDLDFLGEVSPRGPGQIGGNDVINKETENHMFAEDPNIKASLKDPKVVASLGEGETFQSFWFNNGTGFFSRRFLVDIYKKDNQTEEDFINELRTASPEESRLIADRGRKKSAKLLDPKPAKESIAVRTAIETNFWQLTQVVGKDIKVRTVGTRSARNFPIDQFDKMSPEQQQQALMNLRFMATKQWDVPTKVKEDIRKKFADDSNIPVEKVTDMQLGLLLESHFGNLPLAKPKVEYILNTPVVSDALRNKLNEDLSRDKSILTENKIKNVYQLQPNNHVEFLFNNKQDRDSYLRNLKENIFSDYMTSIEIDDQKREIEISLNSSPVAILSSNGTKITLTTLVNYVMDEKQLVNKLQLMFVLKDLNEDPNETPSQLTPVDAGLATQSQYGGIDLNTSNTDIQIERDANGGFKVKFDPSTLTELQKGNFQGLRPVIYNVTPAISILPLLGLEQTEDQENSLKMAKF